MSGSGGVSHGANTDIVEQIALALDRAADQLDVTRTHADSIVRALGEVWRGPDMQSAQASWQHVQPHFIDCVDQVKSAATSLHGQAQAQREASGAGAGGSSLPGGPGGPGGPSSPIPASDTDEPPTPDSIGELLKSLFGTGQPTGLDGAETEDGVPIPNVIGGQGPLEGDQPWTPQGLYWDEQNQWLLTTSYAAGEGDDDLGLLSVQSKEGDVIKQVPLSGNNHYGGVASNGDYVYVSGNGTGDESGSRVTVYDVDDINQWQQGDPPPEPVHNLPVPTGSTITVDGQNVYLGKYVSADSEDPGTLYRYPISPDGSFGLTAGSQGQMTTPTPDRTWQIPTAVNGVAIDGDRAYLSQNYGRFEQSNVTTIDLTGSGSSQGHGDLAMPNLIEGVTFVDGNIWSTYESGANEYNDFRNNLVPFKSIEPRDRVTVTHLKR